MPMVLPLRYRRWLLWSVAALAILCSMASRAHAEGEPLAWPAEVKTIEYTSPADGTAQPALFYDPTTTHRCPLLVALHSWSGNYQQPLSIPYAQWCVEHQWIMIHPNFRGSNRKPQATGSDWVVADILGALQYACRASNVDRRRIYLVGMSGGGMASLLMAGRAPQMWAGVSSWVPIFDLSTWYRETAERQLKYTDQIKASLGGDPGRNDAARKQARRRSPSSWLNRASGVPIDINAGIHDGHPWCVPVSHSLHAFNVLADAADRISETDIDLITETASVPKALRFEERDRLYEGRAVLFRRQSGAVRVTLFEGGHEVFHEAALEWLSHHEKSEPVNDGMIEENLTDVLNGMHPMQGSSEP